MNGGAAGGAALAALVSGRPIEALGLSCALAAAAAACAVFGTRDSGARGPLVR
jgi:hypothetical protein